MLVRLVSGFELPIADQHQWIRPSRIQKWQPQPGFRQTDGLRDGLPAAPTFNVQTGWSSGSRFMLRTSLHFPRGQAIEACIGSESSATI